MEEQRAKSLCSWCDDKFTPGHKCRIKRFYSICLVGDEEEGDENSELEPVREKHGLKSPIHIFLLMRWKGF